MRRSVETTNEIQALEQEIRAKQERLNELLRNVEPEPVDDFELRGQDGAPVLLSTLFGANDELIVIHNMGTKCPYCTLWADGFNGVLRHLEDRAAFVVVSPDEPDVQMRFAMRRGWRFRMLSNADSGFTEAMGFTTEHEGRTYMLPGYSTFQRQPDGTIARVAHAPFGPGDPYCSVWHFFGLLPGGIGDWQPKFKYEA